MKPIHILFACLFLPVAALGQSSNAHPDSSVSDTNLAAEIKSLREALLQTQKQMAAQQREIEALRAQSKNADAVPAVSAPPARSTSAAVGNSAAPAIESTVASASAKVQ